MEEATNLTGVKEKESGEVHTSAFYPWYRYVGFFSFLCLLDGPPAVCGAPGESNLENRSNKWTIAGSLTHIPLFYKLWLLKKEAFKDEYLMVVSKLITKHFQLKQGNCFFFDDLYNEITYFQNNILWEVKLVKLQLTETWKPLFCSQNIGKQSQ